MKTCLVYVLIFCIMILKSQQRICLPDPQFISRGLGEGRGDEDMACFQASTAFLYRKLNSCWPMCPLMVYVWDGNILHFPFVARVFLIKDNWSDFENAEAKFHMEVHLWQNWTLSLSSKLNTHPAKAEWQQADSINGHLANRNGAKRHHTKKKCAKRHHAERNQVERHHDHALRHHVERHYAKRHHAEMHHFKVIP